MPCTKTGCHILIEPYNEYAYGDAFELDGVAYFRLVQRSHSAIFSVLHYTVKHFDVWFDTDKTSQQQCSTLVTDDFENHGYDGIAIER
jgi:hypothetical protein